MRISSFVGWTALVAVLACGSAGCTLLAAGAVGGATVAYAMGDLEGEVEATPQKVVKRAKAVLDEMEVHVDLVDSTSLDGRVRGKTALDKTIEITVKRLDDLRSKVSIRVGTFGDEAQSRQIFDKIKAGL
jgi:hypothetical protein